MVKKVEYTNNENDYLIAPQNSFALSCIITNSAVTADENGKKGIKAGTPLYIGTGKNVYKDREEILTTEGTGNVLVGIARHNIPEEKFNENKANDAVLTQGYVEYYRLDKSVQTMIDSVESTLTNIKFVRGAK